MSRTRQMEPTGEQAWALGRQWQSGPGAVQAADRCGRTLPAARGQHICSRCERRDGFPTADGGRAKVTACPGRLGKAGSRKTDPDVAHLRSVGAPSPGLQHRSARSHPPRSAVLYSPLRQTLAALSQGSERLLRDTTRGQLAVCRQLVGRDHRGAASSGLPSAWGGAGRTKTTQGSYTWWDSCGGSHCPPGTSPIASHFLCLQLERLQGGPTPGPVKVATPQPPALALAALSKQQWAALCCGSSLC